MATTDNSIIPITSHIVSGSEEQCVNARDLHTFLGVGRNFSNWLKGRIEEYGFVENQDFGIFAKTGVNSSRRGRKAIEYFLTLEMAKELAMVEKNDKGREARRYFIECERIAKQPKQDPELVYIHKSVLQDTGKAVVWISPEGWTSSAPYHGGLEQSPGTLFMPGNSRHYLLTVIGGVPQAPVLIDENVLNDFVDRAYPENMLLRRGELVDKIAKVKEIAQVASTDINLILKPLEMRAQGNMGMAKAFQDMAVARFGSV